MPIIWLDCVGIFHNYACFIWDFTLGCVFWCFCVFQVIFVKTDHKTSTFSAYTTHLTPEALGIKASTLVEETRAKGAKVSKATEPKLSRAKLTQAYERLALEIEFEQDHPEGRSTRSSKVGSGQAKVLFTFNSFRISTKAFLMGRASSLGRAGCSRETIFCVCSIFNYFYLRT